MTAPAFDSNTWYTIANFGNDYFLACQGVGSCNASEVGRTDPEWFQLSFINGSQVYYIRPKASEADDSGQPYCVNLNRGQPEIAICSNSSATWGAGYWNGNDASEGIFFYDVPEGNSQRLYLSNNQSFSLQDVQQTSRSGQDLMSWGVQSRGVIDDENYSTIPAAITGSSPSSTATSTSLSMRSATVVSSESSASSPESVSTVTVASSDSSVQTSISIGSSSTVTLLVTPTVTASASSSQMATSSLAATVAPNAAMRFSPSKLSALALVVAIPRIFVWLSQ